MGASVRQRRSATWKPKALWKACEDKRVSNAQHVHIVKGLPKKRKNSEVQKRVNSLWKSCKDELLTTTGRANYEWEERPPVRRRLGEGGAAEAGELAEAFERTE